MINMKLLEIKDLNKNFDNKKILKDINLSITEGKIIGLLGKNGAGKTTLIKLINDLLTPTSGKILVKGKEIGVESKKVISYLPERTYLNKQMKVSEIIDYFKDFYDNFSEKKAKKLLKDLDLDINSKIAKMSKGMQEKLQLVLVMSRNADLYILDEPLGGVDPATREYILDTILSNFNEKASVIISTHLISDIERILDEVIFIDKGKNRNMPHDTDLEQLPRLRLHAFAGVYHHDCRIRSHQSAVSVFREILMARRIKNIDAVSAIVELQHGTGHRDTSLLLDLHPVRNSVSGRRLAFYRSGKINGSAVQQKFLSQSRLAGVRMRNNRKGSSFFNLRPQITHLKFPVFLK